MFLTRIQLDPLKRATLIALNNPNKFHGAIQSSYPEPNERVLWRIDTIGDKDYLLILSPKFFNTHSLVNQFGVTGESAQSKNYDQLLNRITDGSVWNFRLTANPTKSSFQGYESRGKVLGHITEQWVKEWLIKKSAPNGFSVDGDSFRVMFSKWVSFKKHGKGSNVVLREVIFEGTLKVENSILFKKALINGIGRGKAYGMGLMTVIPCGKSS